MELEIYDSKGKKTGKKAKLNDKVFSVEPNDHAIYLDVKQHMANRRQGTHMTLEVSTISGSTRKLHKQKGTGGSRKGSIKNPLFRGGARIFGPRPRNYGFKLNRKVKQLARRSALTYKANDGTLKVLDALKFGAPKTKDYVAMLGALELKGRRSLLVLAEKDDNVLLASRNIQGAKVITANELNTYEIMNCNDLVIVNDAIGKLEETLAK